MDMDAETILALVACIALASAQVLAVWRVHHARKVNEASAMSVPHEARAWTVWPA
jgi:hypothetical protein